jgi:hypothetical protein
VKVYTLVGPDCFDSFHTPLSFHMVKRVKVCVSAVLHGVTL